ncbi:hypothetical protein FCM35_KLT03895 [Carex littledalei]|uniref:Uncharacterized protein n=1 Tax=Carex littledalei TaxID=544730 RepID=A0A833QZM8_9POAL|nr:hypothetical protein FCM35_KLT03895 [Carex littledalei]
MEAEKGDLWKHKFEAIERKRKEAQAERNILQKQVAGLSGNLESAKDLIPTYLQKLKELQSKVLSLEEELESLKTLDEETSSVNLENVAQIHLTDELSVLKILQEAATTD